MLARGVEDRIDDLRGEQVRERDLLDEATDDQEDRPGGRHLVRVTWRGQLWNELTGPDDRPGHEMWEERLVHREVGCLCRADVPAMDVDDI